jgi:hypothetical protein
MEWCQIPWWSLHNTIMNKKMSLLIWTIYTQHKPLTMLTDLPKKNGPSLAYFLSTFSKWSNIGARDTSKWWIREKT